MNSQNYQERWWKKKKKKEEEKNGVRELSLDIIGVVLWCQRLLLGVILVWNLDISKS